MSDVELVIKIPEEKLSIIKNKMYCGIYDPDLYNAIANGIQLPKGHGKLKDVDALMRDYGNPDIKILLDNMDTIIEADKENEDETSNKV